jgi:hypothetical protein
LEQKILKCFYLNKFKVDNYEKGNEDYDYWHKKFLKEKLKENYEVLIITNNGYTPLPQVGYSALIFSTSSIPMLSQPSPDFKPYSRNKPK